MSEQARPQRIQMSRTKGWRMPENTVKVDRTSRWGNPYRLCWFPVEMSIALFKNTLLGYWSPSVVESLSDSRAALAYELHTKMRARHPVSPYPAHELRGKNLACWCKPGTPCHADVLLELANPVAAAPSGAGEG